MARPSRPFDTLQLARALRDGAGFTGEHAEAAAVAIAEWVNVDLVTRRDLDEAVSGLEAKMDSRFAGLEAKIAESQSETLKWVFAMVGGATILQIAASFLHH
jgi:hypothetical protein